jgi:hypothetical protein
MTSDKSSLKKKDEGYFEEKSINLSKLVKTLMKSFLRAESNYGSIENIKTDINRIFNLVRKYIDEEKNDIYALKLDDKILLSKTNIEFEDLFRVIKNHSYLAIKKDVYEIWDDVENNILHLIIISMRKHFPIEYSTKQEKERLLKNIYQ